MNKIIDVFGEYYIDEKQIAHRYNYMTEFLSIRSRFIKEYDKIYNTTLFKWYVRVIDNTTSTTNLDHWIDFISKENAPMTVKNELWIYLLNRSNYRPIFMKHVKQLFHHMTSIEILHFIKTVPNRYLPHVLSLFSIQKIKNSDICYYLECRNQFYRETIKHDQKLMERILRKYCKDFEIEDGEELFIETEKVWMMKNIFSVRPTKKLFDELYKESYESKSELICIIKEPIIRLMWWIEYGYYSIAFNQLQSIKKYEEFLLVIEQLSIRRYETEKLYDLFIERLKKRYAKHDYELVLKFLDRMKLQDSSLYKTYKELIIHHFPKRKNLIKRIKINEKNTEI